MTENTGITEKITVRQVGADEAETLLAADELIWAASGSEPLDVRLQGVPIRAAFVAERDGEIAGICGSWDLDIAVPDGGSGARLVPTEGLTWVGVHPDHRRRGVLTAMVRHHLEWTAGQGRSLAALKASEAGIYGRFGYGVASTVIRASFGRGTRFDAPAAVGELADATRTTFETATPEQTARLRALVQRCATAGPSGSVVRSEDDIRRHLTDVPEYRVGLEPRRVLWATRDGDDVGFAVLRRTPKWTDGSPHGEVEVFHFGSTDAGARLALARRLVDFDLMGSTINWVPLDDPLVLWSASPRTVTGGLTDSLWIRLVDLPAAVADRGHAVDCDLRVEVRDDVLGANQGVWHWQSVDGAGRLERVDGQPAEPADLSLSINDLGAVWLGGQTLGARAAAGFVTEHRPGAVATLDAALRTAVGPTAAADF